MPGDSDSDSSDEDDDEPPEYIYLFIYLDWYVSMNDEYNENYIRFYFINNDILL